jgi:hypothetical protein
VDRREFTPHGVGKLSVRLAEHCGDVGIERSLGVKMIERTERLTANAGTLSLALQACLSEIVRLSGKDAAANLSRLRDTLVNGLKESDIPPDREMEHAALVGPAIEILNDHFDEALRQVG